MHIARQKGSEALQNILFFVSGKLFNENKSNGIKCPNYSTQDKLNSFFAFNIPGKKKIHYQLNNYFIHDDFFLPGTLNAKIITIIIKKIYKKVFEIVHSPRYCS